MTRAEMLPRAPETGRLATEAQRAFWRRVLALVVDLLILSLVNFVINGVFGVMRVTSGSPLPPPGSGFTVFTSSTDVGWGWLTLVWLVYFLGLEALFGATVGKWALRLRVTDREGRRPPLRRLVVRNVARIVDALPVGYMIGGSVALLSAWRQRLGDRLAHTVVLPHEAVTEPLLAPAQLRWRLALVGADIPLLWRTTFALASGIGAIETFLTRQRSGSRERRSLITAGQWFGFAFYLLVLLVAIVPGIALFGVFIAPLLTAGVGLSALVTLGRAPGLGLLSRPARPV